MGGQSKRAEAVIEKVLPSRTKPVGTASPANLLILLPLKTLLVLLKLFILLILLTLPTLPNLITQQTFHIGFGGGQD
jgi:hypothetical protein